MHRLTSRSCSTVSPLRPSGLGSRWASRRPKLSISRTRRTTQETRQLRLATRISSPSASSAIWAATWRARHRRTKTSPLASLRLAVHLANYGKGSGASTVSPWARKSTFIAPSHSAHCCMARSAGTYTGGMCDASSNSTSAACDPSPVSVGKRIPTLQCWTSAALQAWGVPAPSSVSLDRPRDQDAGLTHPEASLLRTAGHMAVDSRAAQFSGTKTLLRKPANVQHWSEGVAAITVRQSRLEGQVFCNSRLPEEPNQRAWC